MAGMKVVPVEVHPDGNLNLEDLRMKAKEHESNLAALMVRHHSLTIDFQVNGGTDHLSFDIWRLRRWGSGCEI
jgi:hypothetical protein